MRLRMMQTKIRSLASSSTTTTTTIRDEEEEYKGFSARALLAAMASQSTVLRVFLHEFDNSHRDAATPHDDATTQVARDDALALLLQECWQSCRYRPSSRYILHLLRSYMKDFCQNDAENITSEELMTIFLELQAKSSASLADPDECGYCTYQIPVTELAETSKSQNRPCRTLLIRLFPYHSDVSLRLWEAGAYLAEYLIHANMSDDNFRGMTNTPQRRRRRRILELGAGVGATGLALCAAQVASHVVFTDYTERALENLRHNVSLNKSWLEQDQGTSCTVAYLDWNQYASDPEHDTHSASLVDCEMQQADLLVAADIAYDVGVLPALARSIQHFLSTGPNKSAIVATTKRNLNTFRKLKQCLVEEQALTCRVVNQDTKPPVLFPSKFHQARSDVELWELACRPQK